MNRSYTPSIDASGAVSQPSWPRRVLLQPVVNLLQQGMTPRALAFSMALGAVIGVFPILGTTTMLCLGTALLFRLNPVAIQLTNWMVYPAQLLLILPFMNAGARWLGGEPLTLSLSDLSARFEADFLGTVASLGDTIVRGIAMWGLVAIPAVILLTLLLYPILDYLSRRRKPSPLASEPL